MRGHRYLLLFYLVIVSGQDLMQLRLVSNLLHSQEWLWIFDPPLLPPFAKCWDSGPCPLAWVTFHCGLTHVFLTTDGLASFLCLLAICVSLHTYVRSSFKLDFLNLFFNWFVFLVLCFMSSFISSFKSVTRYVISSVSSLPCSFLVASFEHRSFRFWAGFF